MSHDTRLNVSFIQKAALIGCIHDDSEFEQGNRHCTFIRVSQIFPYFLSKELHKLHAVVKMLTRPSPPSVIYGSWERSGEKGKNKGVHSQSQRERERQSGLMRNDS